jgi:hypothetical protein
LRIVSHSRADADNNRVNERSQPMQVLQSGRAIDVFRMPGFGCDPAIEGLAELTDNNKIVHRAAPKWTKQIRPCLRKRLLPPSE